MGKLAKWLSIGIVGVITFSTSACTGKVKNTASGSAFFSDQTSIHEYRGRIRSFSSPTSPRITYGILKKKLVSGRTDYDVLLLTPQKELSERDVTKLGEELTNGNSFATVTFWLNQQIYEANAHGEISSRSAIKGLSRNLVATLSKNFKDPTNKTWEYGVTKIKWMQRAGQFSALKGTERVVSKISE